MIARTSQITRAPSRQITAGTAIMIAGALMDTTREDIVSQRRQAEFVRARALATWMLRTVPREPLSYPTIGRALGDRDHSTVIHLHRKAVALRLVDDGFAAACRWVLAHFAIPDPRNPQETTNACD